MSEFSSDINSISEFTTSAIFDNSGSVLGGSVTLSHEQMESYYPILEDRETVVGKGVDFDGEHYDVFRF